MDEHLPREICGLAADYAYASFADVSNDARALDAHRKLFNPTLRNICKLSLGESPNVLVFQRLVDNQMAAAEDVPAITMTDMMHYLAHNIDPDDRRLLVNSMLNGRRKRRTRR